MTGEHPVFSVNTAAPEWTGFVDYAPTVKVKTGGLPPRYSHESDAGADIRSAEDCEIWVYGHRLVQTGLYLEIPPGYVGLVVPRSGIAAKHGVTLLNSPGVIDSGYRGQVLVDLINHGQERFQVKYGDRIAQLLVQKVERAHFVQVENLSASERGHDGHGSTGVK